MDSSPCVLSAGLLVAAGFGLTWTPDALELTMPNGCKTTLRSRGNVPGIVESNTTALPSGGKKKVSCMVDGEKLQASPVVCKPEYFFMEFCCDKESMLCSTLIASNPRVRTFRVTEDMDGDD
eukprot:2087644-Amphidinium_carterae.1